MEKSYSAKSGYLFVFLELVIIAVIVACFFRGLIIAVIVCLVLFVFVALGLVVVNPNESSVLILFGDYKGTIKRNGFFG